MNGKELKILVPAEKLDENSKDWNIESFILEEHLYELINVYGLKLIKDELKFIEMNLKKLETK
jgi:hypothetical protein